MTSDFDSEDPRSNRGPGASNRSNVLPLAEKWSEEDTKILVENHHFGEAKLLALLPSKNRSSLHGKINRLRVAGVLAPSIKHPPKPKPLRAPKPPVGGMIFKQLTSAANLFDRITPKPIPKELDMGKGDVTVYTMGKCQCKFPVPLSQSPDEHMLFCGKRTFKGSWCKSHYYRVFNVKREAA